MKVQTRTTINGQLVTELKSIKGLIFYQLDHSHSDEYIYVTNKKGEVLASIDINCGMGQGEGFVESLVIK